MLHSPFRLAVGFPLEPFLLGCGFCPETSLNGDSLILRRAQSWMVLAMFWRLGSIALQVTIVVVFRKSGIRIKFFLVEFAGECCKLSFRSWLRHLRRSGLRYSRRSGLRQLWRQRLRKFPAF